MNNWIIGSWVVKGEFYISTQVPGKDRATFQPNGFEQTSLSLRQSDSAILSPWKKKTVHWKMHIFILTNLLWCLHHATLPHRGKMFTCELGSKAFSEIRKYSQVHKSTCFSLFYCAKRHWNGVWLVNLLGDMASKIVDKRHWIEQITSNLF